MFLVLVDLVSWSVALFLSAALAGILLSMLSDAADRSFAPMPTWKICAHVAVCALVALCILDALRLL